MQFAPEGHSGIVKMKSRLHTKVWWHKIGADVERVSKSWHASQVVGPLNGQQHLQRRVLPQPLSKI